ncbi:MAG: type II toxin-antitoxin system RelE/ParE family toxin [Turicibacter sp.]|nr:type II toxin-antitoxin system RelE/ParE family toxin [Turicibacter sp.]
MRYELIELGISREIVHLEIFDKQWATLGYDDWDLAKLQDYLLRTSQMHPVIRKTGGLRKARFALGKTGKSGGLRVLYADFPKHGIMYLFDVYSKTDKENISENDKRDFKEFLRVIAKNLEESA